MKVILVLAGFLSALCIVGTLDYSDLRRLDCASRDLSYSFWSDSCTAQQP